MNRHFLAIALLSLTMSSCQASNGDSSSDTASFVGFWEMIEDEDGGPIGSIFELRADNTFVGYSKECKMLPALPYHVYDGDIFVTNEVPGKGRISVLFRLSADGKQLTFTSSNTRNNAVYLHQKTNTCVPKG